MKLLIDISYCPSQLSHTLFAFLVIYHLGFVKAVAHIPRQEKKAGDLR